MKKLIVYIFMLTLVMAQEEYSSYNNMPGSFSRMGFGARGMGMANAASGVTGGMVFGYYNPALTVFQENNAFYASYSFLSLDRSLNFVSFTKKFVLNKEKNKVAGISAGFINSGVSDIPQTDRQGYKTGTLSTSENLFFVSFANSFSEKLSVGINLKFYFAKLYENFNSSTLGMDLGALYRLNNNFSISANLTDLNSKYKWNSTDIYGDVGKESEEKFPLLKKLGVTYKNDMQDFLCAVEVESSNGKTTFVRAGTEIKLMESLVVRGGIDRICLNNFDIPVRPSLGFSYFYNKEKMNIGFDYAFVVDPYSSSDQHIIGLSLKF